MKTPAGKPVLGFHDGEELDRVTAIHLCVANAALQFGGAVDDYACVVTIVDEYELGH